MKKVIIIIIAILLAVFIGIVLPILINNSSTGNADNTKDLKREEEATNLGISDDISENKPNNTPESMQLGSDVPEEQMAISETDDDTLATTPLQVSEEDETHTKSDNHLNGESKVLSESWVEEMIEEYGHHIRDDDMSDLRRLYSQVDIVYLQGMIEGGYTDEDVEEIKVYLQNTLGSDYPRGKDLFYRYSYLMMEVEI